LVIMTERKKLDIDALIYDPELYPRLGPEETAGVSWFTVNKYAKEMQAGAIFPPIQVGIIDDEDDPRHGKLLVNDGVHRWKAYKKLGFDRVDVLITHYEDWVDFMKAAVKANVTHGRNLTFQDKARLYDIFKDAGLTENEISGLILVPMEDISKVKDRILKKDDGMTAYLKAPTAKAYSGGEITEEQAIAVRQKHISTRTAKHALKQLIDIVNGGLLVMDEELEGLCKDLLASLQELVK